MDTGLGGKVAMVSGASKGIGRAVAEQLAAEGAHLSLCARSAGPLRTAAREIETKHGVTCLACPADLSRAEDIQEWVRATVEPLRRRRHPRQQRGRRPGRTVPPVPDQAWLESWQLKLFGYIRVAREVFPHLRPARGRPDRERHRHRRGAADGELHDRRGGQRRPAELHQGAGRRGRPPRHPGHRREPRAHPHGALGRHPRQVGRGQGRDAGGGRARHPARRAAAAARAPPRKWRTSSCSSPPSCRRYITGTTIAIDGGMTRTI